MLGAYVRGTMRRGGREEGTKLRVDWSKERKYR